MPSHIIPPRGPKIDFDMPMEEFAKPPIKKVGEFQLYHSGHLANDAVNNLELARLARRLRRMEERGECILVQKRRQEGDEIWYDYYYMTI